MKYNEIRDKRGNLDEIKKQQQLGQDVGKAKKVDEKNKDLTSMTDILMLLPSVTQLITGINTEEELIKKLQTIYGSDQRGYTAYKLLRYILATNRSSIRKLEGPNRIELPAGSEDHFEQYILIS